MAWLFCTAADGDHVTVTLDQPSYSPFSTVKYDISVRGRTNTATHRRTLPGYAEQLHGMGLLTQDEAAAYWRDIAALQLTELVDSVPPGDAPEGRGLVWRVDAVVDGVRHAFRVADPVNQPDRRYQAILSRTRSLVHRLAGDLPFRHVFIPEARLGWLNVVTVPVARLRVDGFDTELETPLYGYEVAAGKHTLRLTTPDGTHDRSYEVRVDPGGTTLLRVDLR
jgi:hypothetical protein